VDKPKRLLADKAYDGDSFRNWLKRTPSPLDQKDLSAPQCYRTHVLQVEKLATRRNPI
jgi:hypothetical protein